ncbi:GH3 auxin-responsive promoter family protein [Clostridium oryzae]|uniref:GH3 auxin-responsive promoter n=1 Tax=Clostridium oryzae TaxID=1450648 RepID=A0A1V4IEN6_9CLOT|nr:GH3 auxin-responsive promoter family protein [Clostridium oryzae]OPJ58314.1 GH3 auxin-responsive promoter [Clostridium oryzae]
MSIISRMLYGSTIFGGAVVKRKLDRYTRNCRIINEKVLFKILRENSKSEIGLKHDFKSIKTVEEYKRRLPITEYKDYEDYIKRMAMGEKNILISEDVAYFGHTSGTTGKQKLIPVTKSNRRRNSKYMALLLNKFCYDNFKKDWNYGRGLMIADIVTTTYSKGGIPICSATSGGMKGIKPLLPYLYTSPIEVMEIEDRKTALYLHLLFGLKDNKLMYISGVFISSVLDLLRTLEERHKDLVEDIRKGRINSQINIGETKRQSLNKLLTPDAARADELEAEFVKGFKGIVRRVWPSLVYIATVTGANFSIYDEKVNYYTDSIPIYSAAYGATEAMVGINPYVDKIRYVITPDTAFYEFIPVEGSETGKVLRLDEVKLGGKYEIVVTSYIGLYRYKIGDVVRVVGFYNSCPEIEFLYRKKQILNMVAEKTTEDHITSAITKTIKQLNLNLVDYTSQPDISVTPGRYVFYFEFRDSLYEYDVRRFEKVLDEEIKTSNPAYGRARNGNKLARIKVVLLKPNTFNLIKDALLTGGISKNQVKIPRVITDNEKILNIINKNRIPKENYMENSI